MTKLVHASGLACPPRFGTLRDPSRQTVGPAIARTAQLLGRPFMPWQAYVSDVAGEIDPATGELWYDEVVITVTRQSGKTTWKLAKATHRCTATKLFGPRQHITYVAQTRNKAREKFEEEFWPDLEASATFKHRARPSWANGHEHIRFQNGSRFGIEATTEKAGHGGVLDEGYIDEAFSQIDSRSEDAFEPAMLTRASSQLVIVSTAGWLGASPYLEDQVRPGREMVLEGRPTRTAYFEWSAPEDADPGDEAAWWMCMPALGHTIQIDTIRSLYEKAVREDKLAGFCRPYLNQWVPKEGTTETLIDPDSWALLADRGDARPSPVALSVVVSDDRTWSQVGLAGRRPDGRVLLQIAKAGKGTGWVLDEVQRLHGLWKPKKIAVRTAGPEGSLVAAMEQARLPVLRLGQLESAQACGAFVDGVDDGTWAHTGQAQIAVSIGAAAKRMQGTGGAWVWKPKDSTDISPLWAVTNAAYALSKTKTVTRGGRKAAVVLS